ACRASSRAGQPQRTITSLADWLAARSLDELAGVSIDSALTQDLVLAADRLAARSLSVAAAAQQVAIRRGIDPEATLMLGLLHGAGQWLALCLPNDSGDVTSLLPPWLRADLEQIAAADTSDPAVSSAAACVAVALKQTDGSDAHRPEATNYASQPLLANL